jgi:Zn-dependent protease
MSGTLTLFHLRGIPVRVHASWLVIYGLIAWTLAVGYFPHVLPELPAATYWLSALLAALLLFVSVFLHELSHSLVARGYGIPISSITLHIFGGVSQLEREPDRPGAEVAIAIVGPLTSFAVAAAAALGAVLAEPGPVAAAIIRNLVLVNVIVGIFNLVPGFPLDGGRLLRATLWKARGDLAWATRMASQAGGAFGLVLIVLGAWRAIAGEFLGGLWFVVIGLFLRQAAQTSYQHLVIRRAVAPRTVGDAMTREVVQVAPDLDVARLVDDFFWGHHVTSFPVVAGGHVRGIVSVHALEQVPRDQWATTMVEAVMLPLSDQLVASPRDSLWQALEKVSRNGLGRLAIVEDGRLAGYLSVKDVMHVLTVATEAGGPPRPSRTGRADRAA